MDDIAPMIVAVTFILTTGGVIILRPIAKRLTDLIDLYTRDRQTGVQSEVQQMRDLLETMSARVQLLEERQDFTERLLSSEERGRRTLPGTASADFQSGLLGPPPSADPTRGS
jgi:hypothetical protein